MTREIYCEILGTATGLFKNKVQVEVDFGQEKNWFGGKNPLTNEKGKIIKFNSMIDALNHMAKSGWHFINAYSLTIKSDNIYHYVMRKTIA